MILSAQTARYLFVLMASALACGGLLFLTGHLLLVDDDSLLSAVNWRNFENLPFEVSEDIELAVESAPSKRSSLSLVCSTAGTFHLVLLTRMPKRSFLEPMDHDKAVIFIDGIDHDLNLEKLVLVDMGVVDRLVTGELSALQLDRLMTLFGSSPPLRISFMTMERSVFLAGTTSGEPIRAMGAHCVRHSEGGH
jgi:hypothetical protein